ncbi:uncharacterized protein LOC121415325 [Lytechinus variegatus]|uniref:uncharacterized protein LOC121415325 n=1 Tax=Lytechinus variegatus TaxID=7654 RepID=UPI001BB1FD36|nr:uncharacterized protein LOC121415325 [Lytechinus variegatus]XP_041464444.1 uncharacterized protein LOC121415325 [Lytechinus variegatus]
MAASNDAVQHGGKWTLIDKEGNVQGSDSDIGSVSSSDCVAVEEDSVSYHAKRSNNSRSSTANSVSGSPPKNQIEHSPDQPQNVPSSSWLGGFWTQGRSQANSNPQLNHSTEDESEPHMFQQEKDTVDTDSLESIEVLSMPSDNHTDTDIHLNDQHDDTPSTIDLLGAVGTDWNPHGDVAKPVFSTNCISPMEGSTQSSRVEDLAASSNSSQLDFLMVDNCGPKNAPYDSVEAASNESSRGAIVDEEDQMERSIGIAGPLPMMPSGQLPMSSVSVDNIPRGVEAGDSPRRAQSEGCITQQSEGSSGVGVPIMTQRWPTEDGGFLLVQQFRGDGEPAMSRSSSFSDLSSSFSYPGVRRRIPSNSNSSLQHQSSESSSSSSETSHYNSDTSNDALPANMTVSGIKPGIRQYLHRRDESLNSKLNMAAVIIITAAFALVLGHYIGSMQATSHHLGIEAGQVWRLRSLQDQLVTCLDKTKTLLRGAKGSTGNSLVKATGTQDSQPPSGLPTPSDELIQHSGLDGPLSCSACTRGNQPEDRYSEFCNTQCKHDDRDLQDPTSNSSDVSDNGLVLSPIGSDSPNVNNVGNVTSGATADVHTATQVGEPGSQATDTVIKSLIGDDGEMVTEVDKDLPLPEGEPVDSDETERSISEDELSSDDKHALEVGDEEVTEEPQEVVTEIEIIEDDFVDEMKYANTDEHAENDELESGGMEMEDFQNKQELEDPGNQNPQNEEDEEFSDFEESQYSGSSSSSTKDTDFDSHEDTQDPQDDFMGQLSSKLSDSWSILRNFTSDLVGSAANLSVNNVTTQLKENVETLRHQIKDAVSTLQKSNITSHMKDNVHSIGEHLKDAVSSIKEGNFSRTVKDAMQDLGGKVQEVVSDVKESNITSQIKQGLQGLGENIQGAFSSIKENGGELKKPFKKAMKAMKNLMRGKPINGETDKGEENNGRTQKKPYNDKKKGKLHKKSSKSSKKIRKQNLNKKEATRNKAKGERKKSKEFQHGKKQMDGRNKKTNKMQINRNKVRTKNQQKHVKNVKSDEHEDLKRERHGKSNDHQEKPPSDQVNKDTVKEKQNKRNDKELFNKKNGKKGNSKNTDRNEEKPNNRKAYSKNSVPSRNIDIRVSEKMVDMKFESDKLNDQEVFKTDEQLQKEDLFDEKKEEKRKYESKEKVNLDQDSQWEESHNQERHDDYGQRHQEKESRNDYQDKEDDKHRFEDIEWEDIFESFDVRCFGVHDCLRKHREAAVKLYEELLDYENWLTKRCYKKHLDELKDFMEELEEFLAEPFLTDEDLEELMEDFEDMAEDIEEATTKNFWKWMKSWTPRHKGEESSFKRGSKEKPLKEDKEKTLTVTLDLNQIFNFSQIGGDDASSESKDHRRHAGYGYQSNDDWFIRRMQDRENNRDTKDLKGMPVDQQLESNSNWYDHWMQGREEGRTGMTVWDLYQWFSKRQALRHEWRLHEMDDKSNWFLRRP